MCRSSSNSLGRRSYGFGGAPLVGGSLRVRSSCSPHSYPYSAEQESLLTRPSPHPLLKHHPPPPPLLSRHLARRRDRRALSLELPELLRAGGQPPGPLHPDPGRRGGCGTGGSVAGGGSGGGGHRDCNGKTPGPHARLLSEVFPQVNARKDRADLDEETDYVSPPGSHPGGGPGWEGWVGAGAPQDRRGRGGQSAQEGSCSLKEHQTVEKTGEVKGHAAASLS